MVRNALEDLARSSVEAAEPEMLTVPEAAARLRIGKSLAYQLVKDGEFPVRAVRIGRTWRIPRRALDDYIAGATAEAS